MSWLYEQKTGDIYHNGKFVGTGYSGKGKRYSEGRNNPDMEAVKGVGPIPRGKWVIGPARTSSHVGPVAMDLKPVAGTDAHGRSAFMIHGDNTMSNASKGCIILARSIRQQISSGKDRELIVVRDHTEWHPPIRKG